MIIKLKDNNFSWNNILIKLLNKYDIENKLIEEDKKYNGEIKILPKKELVFNAFYHFDLCDLKVVIIGQDPYINEYQAMGLSFSVPNNIRIPPSLTNIYKCIEKTCNVTMNHKDGDLTNWVKQGVLLLNKTLTVFEKKSNSHKKIWKGFANDLIKYINSNREGIIFVLWGNDAKTLKKYINTDKHMILEHTHPSPLARKSFTECNHFSEINIILERNNKKKINWSNNI